MTRKIRKELDGIDELPLEHIVVELQGFGVDVSSVTNVHKMYRKILTDMLVSFAPFSHMISTSVKRSLVDAAKPKLNLSKEPRISVYSERLTDIVGELVAVVLQRSNELHVGGQNVDV